VGRFARQFTKLLLSLLSHAGMKWWVATDLHGVSSGYPWSWFSANLRNRTAKAPAHAQNRSDELPNRLLA
jgi:hypothetical protein